MNTASHILLPVEVDFAATKTSRFTNKAIYSTTIHSKMGRKHCVNNRTLPRHFQSQPNQKFRDVENQRKCCHLLAIFQQKNQLLVGNPSCPEFQLQDWLSKLLDYQNACFYRAVFANFCIPVQNQGPIQRALEYKSSKRVRLSKSYLPEKQFLCNCQFLCDSIDPCLWRRYMSSSGRCNIPLITLPRMLLKFFLSSIPWTNPLWRPNST